QAIERSVRELLALNYFDQASLARGPASRIDEETKTVDLTYDLEEASSDQLELSGGWGGALGLQLQAGVTFSNFSLQNLFNRSAWRPLPTGDGQRLSLSVVTAGTRYQNVSVSFTEPWFRGRQTPAGFSVGYSNFQSGESRAGSAYGRLFYRQRLRWPDDYFQLGTDVGYRLYDLSGETIAERYGLPEGESQELTFTETLSRNSLDSPIFPSNGSSLALTVTVAPPIGDFIQYHKWELTNAWYAPVTGRLTFNVATRFGYIGSLTGDDVQFQRYLVGGTPLDVQGSFRGVGTDLVFMRGYPTEAISPRQDGRAVGGRILNKYATELQLLAVQSAQLSFAPYLFFDAANTWSGFADYNPAQLYRSAGVGARIFLPILGLLDLNYGYQLDPFVGRDGAVVPPQWRFQFSLGGAR
ncbi:MAG TPA: BamA/TamA family outer membrane protein, partial [Rubricoccaceae bacterium]|nr:BamA/TamA family outer membrane protein [Rubricoccaceae bacterium]